MSDEIKDCLRREMRLKRDQITAINHLKSSLSATTRLYRRLTSYSHILSYASFGSELNLWPLNKILAKQKRLILPRVHNGYLTIYHVEDLSTLVLSTYGILEPDTNYCKKATATDIDIILVPGLAFDFSNHRLGYGKGFYDCFLTSLNPAPETLGVGFQQQMISQLPNTSHDYSLNSLIMF